MDKWAKIWSKAKKYVLNWYVLATIIFIVSIVFLGQESLIKRIEHQRKIRELKVELRELKKQVEQQKKDLDELKESPENLERYAREHYYMHADNEDIFLIDEDE